MTKKDLIKTVAANTEYYQKDVTAVVDNLFEVIIDRLQNNENVTINGFGTFESRFRKGKHCHNPATMESVVTEDRYVPYFRPSGVFKDKLM